MLRVFDDPAQLAVAAARDAAARVRAAIAARGTARVVAAMRSITRGAMLGGESDSWSSSSVRVKV